MTDLRIRIATVIMQSCHGVYMDDAVNAADNVIRELGLQRLEAGKWADGLSGHRYITDWIPDDHAG